MNRLEKIRKIFTKESSTISNKAKCKEPFHMLACNDPRYLTVSYLPPLSVVSYVTSN